MTQYYVRIDAIVETDNGKPIEDVQQLAARHAKAGFTAAFNEGGITVRRSVSVVMQSNPKNPDQMLAQPTKMHFAAPETERSILRSRGYQHRGATTCGTAWKKLITTKREEVTCRSCLKILDARKTEAPHDG